MREERKVDIIERGDGGGPVRGEGQAGGLEGEGVTGEGSRGGIRVGTSDRFEANY